jgi:hypothetical protein
MAMGAPADSPESRRGWGFGLPVSSGDWREPGAHVPGEPVLLHKLPGLIHFGLSHAPTALAPKGPGAASLLMVDCDTP